MALILSLAHLLEVPSADLLQELSRVVIVGHPLPDAGGPGLGHKELPQPAALREHQVQAGVPFSAGAAAVGLAADPPALEQVAAEQAALRDEAGQGGAGLAFRHAQAGPGAGRVLCHIYMLPEQRGFVKPVRLGICALAERSA